MSKNKKSKKFDFSASIRKNIEKRKNATSSYGYLNLPAGVRVYKVTPDTTAYFDVIPYEVTEPKHPDRDPELDTAMVGNPYWVRPFKVHKQIGTDKQSVVCPTSIGKKCPICEQWNELKAKGADKKTTDALKTSDRDLFAVIPRNSKTFESEIHLFDFSYHLFRKTLEKFVENDDSGENFAHPYEGKTLKVTFDEKVLQNSKPFPEASFVKFLERNEEIDDSTLEAVPNLDDTLVILSYDELYAKFMGMEEEEDKTDDGKSNKSDDDDPPVKRKKKKAGKDKKDKKDKKKKKDKKGKKKSEEGDDVCPHGHAFGVDCEKTDDCNGCKLWDDCSYAQDQFKRKAK